jgi:hypothetical protein
MQLKPFKDSYMKRKKEWEVKSAKLLMASSEGNSSSDIADQN